MVEVDSDLQEFTTRADANIQSLFALVRDIEASQNGNKNIEQQYVSTTLLFIIFYKTIEKFVFRKFFKLGQRHRKKAGKH